MIIAVSAKQGRMDAEVDPRFGRAAFFMIANTDTMDVYAYDNAAALGAENGAGTAAIQLMAEQKVEVIYTSKLGPKAIDALEKTDIHVVEDTEGMVGEVLSKATQEARALAEEQQLKTIVIDGPPGTSCQAISSLTGVQMVLA